MSTKAAPPAEARASLYIEEEGGRRYQLTEGTAGTYTSAPLMLTAGQRVRLHVLTAKQREYASDYTSVLVTPAIDSLSWKIDGNRLRIVSTAHDDLEAARHYRWSYQETWEFRSRYRSYLEYRNEKLVDRTEDIEHCWGSEAPSTILLGNTLNLSQNVASVQITELFDDSPKLPIKYSIQVKQYALTPEEYQYWEELRKNTENIGSLFDPLPTQLTGNVHNVADPTEPVLGFIGAQSVTEQRIFIDRAELPPTWPVVTGYEACGLYTTLSSSLFADAKYVAIAKGDSGIYYSTAECIDCRERGVNVKPAFWP
ncbi:DUF4249 domain-containing protein [Hymenobacter sp. J193]|nr:DUF4249 domain-containing protein [Hymenobacter sp. J193]